MESIESAFHPGERSIQSTLGVRDELEKRARKVVRDFLPDQHRRFYEDLPFVVVAARDEAERPWATLLSGSPGFVRAPSERRLVIDAVPGAGDPLSGALQRGSDLGLLGIDLARRRRNRANGRVDERSSSPVDELGSPRVGVAIDQTFGNCPRFIVPRNWREAEGAVESATPVRSTGLSPDQIAQIRAARTFFVASGYRGEGESAAFGMDASHRGGPPGFVDVSSERILRFPDYAGNDHFNTFGNLLLDERMGLVFVDFEAGDLLALTGRATIDWSTPDRARFPGAERLVSFEIDEVVRQQQVLSVRWQEPVA